MIDSQRRKAGLSWGAMGSLAGNQADRAFFFDFERCPQTKEICLAFLPPTERLSSLLVDCADEGQERARQVSVDYGRPRSATVFLSRVENAIKAVSRIAEWWARHDIGRWEAAGRHSSAARAFSLIR